MLGGQTVESLLAELLPRTGAATGEELGTTRTAGAGTVRFFTLGPAGSCHEHATRGYVERMGIGAPAAIELIDDLAAAVQEVAADDRAFIVQCSAHLDVHELTERLHPTVKVLDTFIYPTKPIAVLARTDVVELRTIGMPPAAAGYVDLSLWEEVVYEPTKPVVAEKLLAGAYDAGVCHYEVIREHRDRLRCIKLIGAVETTWIVYGRGERATGELVPTVGAEEFWRERAP